MADLDPLIRYRRHAVDEKRRALAALYRQAEDLSRQKEALREEMARETQLAQEAGSVEATAYLGRYLDGVRRKVASLELAIRKAETRIAIAQEDVRAAFAEVKKAEIVQRNRKDREKAEQEKKDSKILDETGIELYRRRMEGDEE